MRKFLFPLAVAVAASAFAQATYEDKGIDQLSMLSPAPGKISLSINESGLAGMTLDFKREGSFTDVKEHPMSAEVNRSADLFITTKRNGEVVSNVPASNTQQVKFDNFMNYNWNISLFLGATYESTAGGHYEVTIPEGFFLVGENKTPNKEIVVNYTMDANAVSIFPAEAGNHYSLQDFVVTFGNAVKAEVNPQAEHGVSLFSQIVSGASEDDSYEFPAQLSISGNAVSMHIEEAVTIPGTWALDIPAQYFILTDAEGNVTYSGDDLIFRYVIPTVSVEDQPTLAPVGAQTLDFPGVIEMILPASQRLMFPNEMGLNALYRINEDGSLGEQIADYRAAPKKSAYYYELGEDGKVDTSKPIAENANKVFLLNRLGEDISICPAPGMYQLKTSKAIYQFYDEAGKILSSPSFTYNFEVVEGNLFDQEFTPATDKALPSLQEIKVTFPDADEIVVTWGVASFRSNTTNYQFYPKADPEDPQSVIFYTGVPVTMPGTYRLISDTKSVLVDNEYVVVMAEYTISEETGVECVGKVDVMPAVFNIYNAQGILVAKDANVDVLNALPAGIYIAGGKKFINR